MNLSDIFGFLYSRKFLIILATVSLFLGLAFYVYSIYIAPKLNPDFVPNKEFIEQGSGKDNGGLGKNADVYYIHANWCPFCKKVNPVWQKIKGELDGSVINNYSLKFIDIEGEKEEKKMKEFEDTYLNGKQVEGYPTICIVKDNQVIEFEAKPNEETLKEFINTVL
uniref:Thioredoxin domain-containing protein n=1 Tax=viral metagenome TaxID=1070528 RepID=A0A6C0C231_9ZZZZ